MKSSLKDYKFIFISLIMINFTFISEALANYNCPEDRTQEEYFCLPVEKNQNRTMNLVNFYTIPAQIIGLFSKEIKTLNASIVLDANWESPYFGAGVSLQEENFHLMILGGMTRIESMTEDAYAAIVCHELGHVLAGEPRQTIPSAEWSSSEGQSDFFAASVCLPRYFKLKKINPENVLAAVENAGYQMMNALKKFDSNTPINERIIHRHAKALPAVKTTLINRYPTLQCRYETFKYPKKRAACWFNP